MKNQRGLNAFHIYAEYPGSNKPAGYNVAKVDKVVDMAEKSDLYVVLTIGSGGENGRFHQDFVTAFWDFYAPRYKDKTFVVYEVCNEPQAWSAPYNNNTLTMEKNGFAQIRALAPDTHIMMMSYSQPNNWTQAANECANLGISWDNASVAFHTYGIDGREDSTLTSFYKALQAKGIAYACTEPNLTLKAITTKLFERDGISETQFINVRDIATNPSAFSNWITSNKICWTPDFGTWPSCSGSVPGNGGVSGSGGRVGAGGSTGIGSGTRQDAGLGGAVAAGGTSGSGGVSSSGGQQGVGGVSSLGGTTSGSGGALSGSGGSFAGGSTATTADTGSTNGCNCVLGKGPGRAASGAGGLALLLGFSVFAFARKRRTNVRE